jgi:hypothetical protein
VFVEQSEVLEAVVEVALGGGVPVSVVVAPSPVVGLGAE